MADTRTCREFMRINDPTSRVNCATCIKWDREEHRCRDEEGVVGRYEDSEVFGVFDRQMKSNRGIFME